MAELCKQRNGFHPPASHRFEAEKKIPIPNEFKSYTELQRTTALCKNICGTCTAKKVLFFWRGWRLYKRWTPFSPSRDAVVGAWTRCGCFILTCCPCKCLSCCSLSCSGMDLLQAEGWGTSCLWAVPARQFLFGDSHHTWISPCCGLTPCCGDKVEFPWFFQDSTCGMIPGWDQACSGCHLPSLWAAGCSAAQLGRNLFQGGGRGKLELALNPPRDWVACRQLAFLTAPSSAASLAPRSSQDATYCPMNLQRIQVPHLRNYRELEDKQKMCFLSLCFSMGTCCAPVTSPNFQENTCLSPQKGSQGTNSNFSVTLWRTANLGSASWLTWKSRKECSSPRPWHCQVFWVPRVVLGGERNYLTLHAVLQWQNTKFWVAGVPGS